MTLKVQPELRLVKWMSLQSVFQPSPFFQPKLKQKKRTVLRPTNIIFVSHRNPGKIWQYAELLNRSDFNVEEEGKCKKCKNIIWPLLDTHDVNWGLPCFVSSSPEAVIEVRNKVNNRIEVVCSNCKSFLGSRGPIVTSEPVSWLFH